MENQEPNAASSTTDGRHAHVSKSRKLRKWLIGASCALLLIVLIPIGYGLYLNSSINNIERVEIGLDEDGRPKPTSGETLLLLGVDLGNDLGTDERLRSASIAEDSRKSVWPVDKYNSDSMMLVHIPNNETPPVVVSIPRDSYATVFDGSGNPQSKNRVNEALNLYGPSAAVSTVEKLTNLRIDHLAMVDFNGFMDISIALGGVEVYVPETTGGSESSKKGTHNLKGWDALQYVRTRKDLPNSDYSRIRRQQNFLRAAMKKVVSAGTLANPAKLKRTLDSVTKNLSVDADWSASEIRGLAFSLRDKSGSDVEFVTLPIDGYSHMIDGIGSVVMPDTPKIAELTKAIRGDRVDQFVKKYPKQTLEDETKVR